MAVTTSLLSEVVEVVVGAMLADYIALWWEGEVLTDWALVTTPAPVCTVQPSTVSLSLYSKLHPNSLHSPLLGPVQPTGIKYLIERNMYFLPTLFTRA